MVFGMWCVVYDIWHMVFGIWYAVYGMWYMVYGSVNAGHEMVEQKDLDSEAA